MVAPQRIRRVDLRARLHEVTGRPNLPEPRRIVQWPAADAVASLFVQAIHGRAVLDESLRSGLSATRQAAHLIHVSCAR